MTTAASKRRTTARSTAWSARLNTIALEPGAVVTMFTDGVTEARSGGVMLQSEGVRDVVREHASERADEIASAIYSRASEFAEGRLRDDVAIIVVKLASSE